MRVDASSPLRRGKLQYQRGNKLSFCRYDIKNWHLLTAMILLSYLKKLEADSKRLERLDQQHPNQIYQQVTPENGNEDISPSLLPEENSMLNPLFDGQPENLIYKRASEPVFVGEASCAAFSNRILQCLDGTYPLSTVGFSNYYRVARDPHITFDSRADFPERMHAKLLLNVVRRFIGSYPLPLLEASFIREIDVVYRREVMPSALWLCKFYTLLCLGEIYTNRRGVGDNRVPGTDYYIKAVNILREAYEEPSLLQVEVFILLVRANTKGFNLHRKASDRLS